MMALAAQDAADDQDHLGVGLDAPGVTHRLDALARDIGRIEALEVDAARHDRDPLPRRAVAVVDQLRDLLAHRDDAVAARHDAVVQVLEDVLVAKALVPAGDERNAAQPRGDEGAPGRRRGRAHGSHRIGARARAGSARRRCAASEADCCWRHRAATNSPPAAVTSATSRPARDATMARWPAAARMRTSPTAPTSAAPPSRVGTTMSTVIGSRAWLPEAGLEMSPLATALGRFLTAGIAGAGTLDITLRPRNLRRQASRASSDV